MANDTKNSGTNQYAPSAGGLNKSRDASKSSQSSSQNKDLDKDKNAAKKPGGDYSASSSQPSGSRDENE